MSSRHFLGCAAVLGGAAAILAIFAPSASTLALVGVFLLCPLVMVVAMMLIMGGGHGGPPREHAPPRPELPHELPHEVRR